MGHGEQLVKPPRRLRRDLWVGWKPNGIGEQKPNHYGEMFRTVLMVFVFVLLASVILRRVAATKGLLSIFERGAGAVVRRVIWVLVAVGVLYGAYASGHSGAKAVWEDKTGAPTVAYQRD